MSWPNCKSKNAGQFRVEGLFQAILAGFGEKK
jgi:hypothetical protein